MNLVPQKVCVSKGYDWRECTHDWGGSFHHRMIVILPHNRGRACVWLRGVIIDPDLTKCSWNVNVVMWNGARKMNQFHQLTRLCCRDSMVNHPQKRWFNMFQWENHLYYHATMEGRMYKQPCANQCLKMYLKSIRCTIQQNQLLSGRQRWYGKSDMYTLWPYDFFSVEFLFVRWFSGNPHLTAMQRACFWKQMSPLGPLAMSLLFEDWVETSILNT